MCKVLFCVSAAAFTFYCSLFAVYEAVSEQRVPYLEAALKEKGVLDMGQFNETYKGRLKINFLEDKDEPSQIGIELMLFGTVSNDFLYNFLMSATWDRLVKLKIIKAFEAYNVDCIEEETWLLLLAGLAQCSLEQFELHYTNLQSSPLKEFLLQPFVRTSLHTLVLRGQLLEAAKTHSAAWYTLFSGLEKLMRLDLQATLIGASGMELLRKRETPFDSINLACNPYLLDECFKRRLPFSEFMPDTEELDLSYCFLHSPTMSPQSLLKLKLLIINLLALKNIKKIKFYQDYPMQRILGPNSFADVKFLCNSRTITVETNRFFNPTLLEVFDPRKGLILGNFRPTSPCKSLMRKVGLQMVRDLQSLTVDEGTLQCYGINLPRYEVIPVSFEERRGMGTLCNTDSLYLGQITQLNLTLDSSGGDGNFEDSTEIMDPLSEFLKGNFFGVRKLGICYAPAMVIKDEPENLLTGNISGRFKCDLLCEAIDQSQITSLMFLTLTVKLPELTKSVKAFKVINHLEEVSTNAYLHGRLSTDNNLRSYLDARFCCENVFKLPLYLENYTVVLQDFDPYWSESGLLGSVLNACIPSSVAGLKNVTIEIQGDFKNPQAIMDPMGEDLKAIAEKVERLKHASVNCFSSIFSITGKRRLVSLEKFCKQIPMVHIKLLAKGHQKPELQALKSYLKVKPWFVGIDFKF